MRPKKLRQKNITSGENVAEKALILGEKYILNIFTAEEIREFRQELSKRAAAVKRLKLRLNQKE
ncbi:MAG: hypothetical protein ABI602_02650 [Candidatus Saccharibacteria bacterium]